MIIDVWAAVRWWDEWQLRILVLASLTVQWFLLVAGPIRKYTIPQWFRRWIWLAYVGSDALAIYALATLFNRHAKASSVCNTNVNGGKAGVLEILWAPVLLIHLGGRELTAYNIEDNELWLRHTVTLVSQVAVAVYAFYKSWPTSADRRLRASGILLFIIGVLSFSEKPWAFNRARVHRLAAAASSLIEAAVRKPVSWWKVCFTELEVENMFIVWPGIFMSRRRRKRTMLLLTIKRKVHMLLSDMSLLSAQYELNRTLISSAEDLEMAKKEGEEWEFDVLGKAYGGESFALEWLRKAFALIYTRQNVVWTPAYLTYHLAVLPALHAAAIALFVHSHKRGRYSATDVKITYVLLCFTAALDVMGLFMSDLLHWLLVVAGVPSLCEWVSQCNLIDEALRRRQPAAGCLVWFVRQIGCQEGFFLCRRDNDLYHKVAGYLILDVIRKGKKIKGCDLGTYRVLDSKWWPLNDDDDSANNSNNSMTSLPGPITAEHSTALPPSPITEHDDDSKMTEVQRTLQLESFDRSVLLWHIATDLCLCLKPPTAPLNPREVRTGAISNYMAHLLNFLPDMLMTGTRQRLFTEAIDEVEQILIQAKEGTVRHIGPVISSDQDLAKTILEYHRNLPHNPPRYPLIHDACRLAKELLDLEDEDKRWDLMNRVWTSMLFYSATMCRGYLHAKSLGEGGEFLTFVWLLLSIKGAMTLPDKLQMPQPADADAQEKAHDIPSLGLFQNEEDWEL